MKKYTLRVYSLEILLLIILFFTLIALNKTSYIVLALILGVLALITKYSLSNKKTLSISKKQVVWLMLAFAIIYLGIFYFLGMIKYDFYRAPITFSVKTLINFIIPISLIIVFTEYIRYVLLSQEALVVIFKKRYNLSNVLAFICMVLIDLILYIGIYDLRNFDDFFTVLGFIFFASVSCNLFYNYVTARYGSIGVIVYRLITVLYVYFIPIIPDMYIYFRAFLRMVYPYLMYMLVEWIYENVDFAVSYGDRRKNAIGITITLIVMLSVTMLISCQFKYGLLVIGSESMTGTINIGDAVIYESYNNNKEIKNGDIIIFNRDGIKLVHRVVGIKNINNQIRYFTKGDANEDMDNGYVVDSDIIGVNKFKIMYIGYPTLWVRDLFYN